MNLNVSSIKEMYMNKKIIFILYSLSVGGAERRAASIANYLVNNGFEIEVLLLDNSIVKFEIDSKVKLVYLTNNEIEEDASNNRVSLFYSPQKESSLYHKARLKVSGLTNHKLYKAYDQLEYLIQTYSNKIYDYVKDKHEYTIVSWMSFANVATCYALRKLPNEIIIVECMSPDAEFPKGHHMNILKEKYYPYAKKCICQTPDEADYYDYLSTTKKYIIPNPIQGSYPQRYVGIRKKVIVNFCRLEPQKNIPLLIDSFNLLHKDYPEYELHIFGEGSQKENLINYVCELGFEESIRFFDFDVNIHDRIKDYSMFVTSSNREGMSNSMLEALAIGLPTISTDCPAGAARMLIENYVNGIVVPMNDKQAMYEAMKFIIENPEKAEEISVNSTSIREQLSIDRIGQKWIEAITE